ARAATRVLREAKPPIFIFADFAMPIALRLPLSPDFRFSRSRGADCRCRRCCLMPQPRHADVTVA
ncbi:hypothetical protein NPIL_481331, partial [Nephila pilipes]